MKLREKLSTIQNEFKSKKSRYNSFGKYNFRSAEDILEGLKPFNKKYNVHFTVKENLTVMGVDFPIIHSTATIHDNESDEFIDATAIVGVDLNAKGQQMPQKFGSASSYGKKYALGNLLLIDDTADSDAVNDHGFGNKVNNLEKKILASKKPVINTSNIDQAKKFLANGGLLKTLQEKYNITEEVLSELKNE
ncbi:recombinase [Candidatus Woesearchaeota archaeon]|nr:recombinase [Candidatus Woesearchaeota archaeon]